MSDLEEVLVNVKDNVVSVQVLAEVDGQPAVSAHGTFFQLGTVRETTVPGVREGTTKKAWAWYSEGYSGTASSRTAAIDDMLEDAGYVGVPLTETIPDLLGGLL